MRSKSRSGKHILAVFVIGLATLFCLSIRASNVSLTWGPSTSTGVAGYNVYYGTASGEYVWATNVGVSTNVTLSGLNGGTTYYFSVTAYDTEGDESADSNESEDAVQTSDPEITGEPQAQTVVQGANVNFSVIANGSSGLSYQWYEGSAALPGANNFTLTLTNTGVTNTGNYSVIVSDSAGSVLSSIASLTVEPPSTGPVITAQPTNVAVSAGGTAVFSVTATDTVPMSYQWYNGQTSISGATSATLTVAGVNAADTGTYYVMVADGYGTATSSPATLTLSIPTIITTEPVSQTAVLGGTAVFSIDVTGTGPFTYSWYSASGRLNNATNSTLVISNVTTASAGTYLAAIVSPYGVVWTADVVLTVTSNNFVSMAGTYNGLFYQTNGAGPNVLPQSAGMLANCVLGTNGIYGAHVNIGGFSYPFGGTFSATGSDSEIVSRAASGLAGLSLALKLDMTGNTQSITGTVSNMDVNHPWQSSLIAVLATNSLPVPTGNFSLVLPALTSSVNSPQSPANFILSSRGSTVTVFGVLPDGSSVLQAFPISQAGFYPFYVTLYGGAGVLEGWMNLAGGVSSGMLSWVRPAGVIAPPGYPLGFTNVLKFGTPSLPVVNIPAGSPPVITGQPVNQNVVAGATGALSVTASGSGLSYQWYDGATAVAGATAATLTLANISAGNYTVVVNNIFGSVTSSVATVTVTIPPSIIVEPPSQTVVAGGTVVFAVIATGTSLAYQWYDGSTALAGATSPILTLADVSPGNAGYYSVVVSNSAGSVTSGAAALTVIVPPAITSPPASQSVKAGSTAVFSVGVAGTTLNYRWYFDGTALGGATGSTLTLPNVTASSAGSYTVTIQNSAGAASSPAATLTVTSAFASLAGSYNGLFYQTNGTQPNITQLTAGMLANCLVGTNGVYSAKVYIDGFSYGISGQMNPSGFDSEVVSCATNGLSNLTVSLDLDMTGVSQTIVGSVSNMDAGHPWTAPLVAALGTNTLPVPSGTFYLTLPVLTNSPNSPQSSAPLQLISAGGNVVLFGFLEDGSLLWQSFPISAGGYFPIYVSLYGGLGLMEGWMNLAGGVTSGDLTWIRPSGIVTATPFPLGFTNVMTIGSAGLP